MIRGCKTIRFTLKMMKKLGLCRSSICSNYENSSETWKKKKKEKESWEQCTSASFSVGRNYSPRDFRLIKLEGNYVIFVALLAGPKNKKKKNSTDRSGRWKEKFTQCWIQMCDYFKITRLKRIFCVTEPFSYRTFPGYTLFETIEKISFLGD